MLNKMNGYFEEIKASKYLMLVPTNESKKTQKLMKNWIKTTNLIS